MPEPDSLLELATRRRIYQRLLAAPGTHLRQLQRDLDMPMGTLEYHLYQMERAGLLVVRDEGRFKAYFVEEGLDRRDRDILYYLRQRVPRRLAMEIANAPGITFQELAGRVGVGASTLSFHLKKLRRAGLVEERRIGAQKAYVCTDAQRVQSLVVRYRSSFVDAVVDRFADAWLDLGPR